MLSLPNLETKTLNVVLK